MQVNTTAVGTTAQVIPGLCASGQAIKPASPRNATAWATKMTVSDVDSPISRMALTLFIPYVHNHCRPVAIPSKGPTSAPDRLLPVVSGRLSCKADDSPSLDAAQAISIGCALIGFCASQPRNVARVSAAVSLLVQIKPIDSVRYATCLSSDFHYPRFLSRCHLFDLLMREYEPTRFFRPEYKSVGAIQR